MLMLLTLKTGKCLLVLLKNADQVLEPVHSFPFLLLVPILFLGGASKEIINAHYFYGGVGWMIRQLQQLGLGELFLCLPVNDLEGGVRFALGRVDPRKLVGVGR